MRTPTGHNHLSINQVVNPAQLECCIDAIDNCYRQPQMLVPRLTVTAEEPKATDLSIDKRIELETATLRPGNPVECTGPTAETEALMIYVVTVRYFDACTTVYMSLNDPSTSSEDEGYPSRSRERDHKAFPATCDLTDLSGSTTIDRNATMLPSRLSLMGRLMFSAMPMDFHRDEGSGIRIAYRANEHLLIGRRIQASTRPSTTTVRDLFLADERALNTKNEEDMQRSTNLFSAGCANFD
nr:unnamed protein product [Spirometra erinaceieuropaei]